MSMVSVVLKPGLKHLRYNATKLIKAGHDVEEAYDIAFDYAKRMSKRRFSQISNSSQREQRKR